MMFASITPFRSGRARLVASVSALLLSGCAGAAQNGPASEAASAAASGAAPVVAAHWIDGDYQGERSPDVGNPDCGFEVSVGYDVHGDTIALRTHKQRRELTGVIDRSGHFSMASADGHSLVAGSLNGDTLTATETTPPHHHRHSGNVPVQGGVCTAQITARRVAVAPTADAS